MNAWYCTALHYTAMFSNLINCTELHCTPFLCSELHSTGYDEWGRQEEPGLCGRHQTGGGPPTAGTDWPLPARTEELLAVNRGQIVSVQWTTVKGCEKTAFYKELIISDMIQQNVCKYQNVGYCKYKDQCRSLHVKEECEGKCKNYDI